MIIFSLVAMTGLEKCCITSAYLQWQCHSGERPVARGPRFILGRDVAAYFEINCTNVLGLVCNGAAILEINKLKMKTDRIRKLVRTNYVTNVYKNRDCLWLVEDFFFVFLCKKKKKNSVGAFFESVGKSET